jgi:ABC-type microcin C transport system permease subunit YejE
MHNCLAKNYSKGSDSENECVVSLYINFFLYLCLLYIISVISLVIVCYKHLLLYVSMKYYFPMKNRYASVVLKSS